MNVRTNLNIRRRFERSARNHPTSRKCIAQVVERVAAWPGITTGEGQFNSTTLQIGLKEIGHVHIFGPLDISYQQSLRDQLIEEGQTGKHHIFPKSNYTTFSIDSQDDIDTAVWLLRVSYLYHVAHIQRREAADEKLLDIDVNQELADAAVSDDVRSIFEEHFEWLADDDGTNVNQKLYTGGVS